LLSTLSWPRLVNPYRSAARCDCSPSSRMAISPPGTGCAAR
jgi:hypothetical protein